MKDEPIIHITAGSGGEFEMVKKINLLFLKNDIKSDIICIKPNSSYKSLNLKTFFDEEIISFKKLKFLKKETSSANLIFYHYIGNLSAIVIMLYLKIFCRKKIIGIFHSNLDGPGNFFKELCYKIRKFIILNLVIGFSSKIIFVSIAQRNLFLKSALFKNKFKIKTNVIHNYISSNIILPKVEKTFCDTQIIFVGRLSVFKGFADILSLIEKVQKKFPFTFDIVGKGSLKKFIPKFDGLVNYYGYVDSSKILHIYDKCNYLFFPSYTESFGLVLIEAMARGLVVLASDIPAIREIICPGKNGFLFPPGDIKKMEEILLFCKDNPKKMEEISKNNISAVKKFSDDFQGKKYIQLYKEVCC